MAWFTTDEGKHVNTEWFDEDEKRKYKQLEQNQEEAKKLNLENAGQQYAGRDTEKEAWREKDPKYQEKTLGGVYFWDSPNSIWGQVINKELYNKLPKYIQKSVIALEKKKTMDGIHAEIWYVNKDGLVEYFDEYGIGDFMYSLKSGDKKNYSTVSDWNYDGKAKEGTQLARR